LSKKCNFEPRASVSSVDHEGQRPSHGPRCDHQYDRGCEHQTQQTEQEHMLAHVGAYSAYATLPSPGLLPPSPPAEQATAR
jgi:hypothetical protein